MIRSSRWVPTWLLQSRVSLTGWLAVGLVVAGLLLGTIVHKGFMILLALGTFGPAILRQFGLLADLDELQRESEARAGLRAYLSTGVLLITLVIVGGWDVLSLSNDQVPASGLLIVMWIVYYASYGLSFWSAKVAVSRLLLVVGLFWLGFVLLSHGGNPVVALWQGLAVPGPFLLGALLCRYWPRVVGVGLIGVCFWAVHFFHLLPTEPDRFSNQLFVIALVPLPLFIAGIALLTSQPTIEVASVEQNHTLPQSD